MVPWLVLLGVILAPSAAFLFWGWRASRRDVSLMRATETTPAAEVAKLPRGSLVEVKGRLRCDAPVTGDLSKRPCAHFTASVERDYEIVEYGPSRKASYRVRRTACELANEMFARSTRRKKCCKARAFGRPPRPRNSPAHRRIDSGKEQEAWRSIWYPPFPSAA